MKCFSISILSCFLCCVILSILLRVLLAHIKFIVGIVFLSLFISISSLNLSNEFWFLNILNDILSSTFHFLHSWIFFDFLSYNRSTFFCLLDSGTNFFLKLIWLKIVHSLSRFLLNKMSTLDNFALNIFPVHNYKKIQLLFKIFILKISSWKFSKKLWSNFRYSKFIMLLQQ